MCYTYEHMYVICTTGSERLFRPITLKHSMFLKESHPLIGYKITKYIYI